MEGSTDQLINSVQSRLRTNIFLSKLGSSLIIFGALTLITILIARMTGLIPDLFQLQFLLVPVSLSFLVAFFIPSKVKTTDAARKVDSYAKSDDLFLTCSTLKTAAGDFKSLLYGQADAKAEKMAAAQITEINWQKPLTAFITLSILYFLFSLYLPQLDPFGKEEQRAKIEQKRKVMQEEKKQTENRLAVLKKQEALPKNSEDIKAELTQIFKDMKKMPPPENVKKLRDERRKIAKAWSDKNRDLQSEKKSQQMKSQRFGAMSDEMKKIGQDLKSGDTMPAQSKLKKLANELREASNLDDIGERQKKIADLKQQMDDLKDSLSENMGADSVKAAIDRAMRQMDGMDDESKEALMDAAQSMELSQRELNRLQKLMDEMDDLQELMQTAQNAEQYSQNQQSGQKSGQGETPEYESFEDYQEYFDQQQSEMEDCETCQASGQCQACNGTGKDKDGNECSECQGNGNCSDCNGTGQCNSSSQSAGGRGQGRGSGRPGSGGGYPGENENTETAQKREQSKSKNQAGRILMQWKTKGVSESGQVTVEYKEALKQVKAGVDEAIAKEKIPPGYHEVIKKYFKK